jgi:hypothetical protein
MSSKIEIKRLTFDTIFRLLLFGFLFSLVPFSLLMGVLSLFGVTYATWNNQLLTGIPAIIYFLFLGLLMSLLFTGLFGFFISFGLWLFSNLKPFVVRYIATSNRQR